MNDSPTEIVGFVDKLIRFVQLVEAERNASTERRYANLNAVARENGRAGYHMMGYDAGGKRFVRVWDNHGTRSQDTQQSVAYFVERETGIIYGAKSWKAYNPNRQYGTLDTTDQYEWGEYYAKPKDGSSTLVPKDDRR